MTISRDKSVLNPKFATQLISFEEALQSEVLPFSLFMGLRTWAEQDALWAQGRTTSGKIVTNAKGGDSWHNYGLAADYVWYGLAGGATLPQWSWDVDAKLWVRIGEIAVGIGLEWGGNWKTFKDLPHVQNRFGLTLVEAKELYRLGGLTRVWREIGGL